MLRMPFKSDERKSSSGIPPVPTIKAEVGLYSFENSDNPLFVLLEPLFTSIANNLSFRSTM